MKHTSPCICKTFAVPSQAYNIANTHYILGGSNDNAQTKLQASSLRRHGVTVFSVGVGSGYNLAELNEIATDPDETHVLTVHSFNALDTIEETLAERTCEGEVGELWFII